MRLKYVFRERIISALGLMRWNVLASIINTYDFKYIVEVGVAAGHTSFYLLKHCPGILFYCGVDPYVAEDRAPQYDIAAEVYDRFPKALLLRMSSRKAAAHFIDVDLVFIDGDHNDLKNDLKYWLPKCKLLLGHDYHKDNPQIIKIVDKFKNVKHYADSVYSIPGRLK